MNPVATIALKLVRNRWFWIALLVLFALLMLRKYWPRITAYFRPDRADYSQDPALSEDEKRSLRQLAEDVFAEFDGITLTTEQFDRLQPLDNTRLRYVAEQYRIVSGGESLREAIDNEAIAGDSDSIIIARLFRMGL